MKFGLPIDSADCIRVVKTGMVFFIQEGKPATDYIKTYNTERNEKAEPCWSVGQLMEIVDIASYGNNYLSQNWDNTLSAKETSGSYVNYIVEYIADNITQLDFSKLEEKK